MKSIPQVSLERISAYVNRGFSPSYVESNGLKVLNQKCVRNGRIDFDLARLSSHNKKIPAEKYLVPGDILINSTGVGTAGRVAFYNSPEKISVDSHVTILRINPEQADPKYVFYCLFGMEADIETFAEGSTGQIELSRDRVKEIEIPLPKLPEQRAIAAVLSSLDDKIDLLHRQNKTLESLASTLWRKMFIEDANPKWKIGVLGDMVELCYGKALKEEMRIAGKYPVVGSSGVVGTHNDFLVNGPGIVIGRKGTLGLVSYIPEDFWPIDTTFYIKSKSNSKKLYFEYFLLKEFAFEDMNSDSAVPGLNKDIAESMEFIVPSPTDIEKFNQDAEGFLEKKLQNQLQINKLSHMRDAILPKLLSMEVRTAHV